MRSHLSRIDVLFNLFLISSSSSPDPFYPFCVPSFLSLPKSIFTQTNATMDLVLFEDAMKHIARIVRVVMNSGGHALLGERWHLRLLPVYPFCTSLFLTLSHSLSFSLSVSISLSLSIFLFLSLSLSFLSLFFSQSLSLSLPLSS